MSNITKIVIAMDTQDSSNVGWAYWVHSEEDIESSGPLGKPGRRARSLTSLRRELARESTTEFANLLRKIGDDGFSRSDRYDGWVWTA